MTEKKLFNKNVLLVISTITSFLNPFMGAAVPKIGNELETGQMMSMGIATLIIHIFIGESKISEENHLSFIQSIHIIFFVFSILCIVGVFASLARGKKI
jgi:hypothetical protein